MLVYKGGSFTYNDVYNMPIHYRRLYLKLLEEGHNLNNRKYTFLISHMSEIQDRMMQQIHLNENTITLKY